MSDVRSRLADRWRLLCDGVGLGARADVVFARLADAYEDSARRYHTLDHLEAVLDELVRLEDAAAAAAVQRGSGELERDAVLFAAFFHDAVMRADGGSEEASADLAERELRFLGAGPTFAQRVGELICVTDGHIPGSADVSAQWLCDADLGVLSGDEREYARYVEQVRSEYAHVPDDLWRAGRSHALNRLLSRPRMYWLAGSDAERAARENISDELSSLAAS